MWTQRDALMRGRDSHFLRGAGAGSISTGRVAAGTGVSRFSWDHGIIPNLAQKKKRGISGWLRLLLSGASDAFIPIRLTKKRDPISYVVRVCEGVFVRGRGGALAVRN